jgi:cytochrome c-type biogenesis protein CcmH
MLLWVVFAVMSAGVVVMLLHPLLARRDDAAASVGAATAVYRDQLAEVEAEANRGLIGAEEAESARREISRRIIASAPTESDRPSEPAQAGSDSEAPRRLRTRIAAATGLLLPLMALAVYLQTGSPGIPSQSIEARRAAPAADSEMAKLISAVETRLKEHPDDGRGWDVIAPVYLRLGRYAEAAQAYAHAARLLGENARRLSGLAEAIMLRDNGRVGDEARNALKQLLKLEPGHVQARFWLAFAKEQDGQFAEAVADYEKLMAEAPSGAEWRPALEQRIAAARTALGQASSAATDAGDAGKGPTAADIAAAARLSPNDRQAMIDGMVSGLAARLEKDGRDLDGWRKLIRALTVLGRKDEAVAALGRARKSLAGEPQALAALSDLAKSLGLGT